MEKKPIYNRGLNKRLSTEGVAAALENFEPIDTSTEVDTKGIVGEIIGDRNKIPVEEIMAAIVQPAVELPDSGLQFNLNKMKNFLENTEPEEVFRLMDNGHVQPSHIKKFLEAIAKGGVVTTPDLSFRLNEIKVKLREYEQLFEAEELVRSLANFHDLVSLIEVKSVAVKIDLLKRLFNLYHVAGRKDPGDCAKKIQDAFIQSNIELQ
jgi:hypothetical protein